VACIPPSDPLFNFLSQFSGITTVLSSAALVLALQRFSQVSPLQQTLSVRVSHQMLSTHYGTSNAMRMMLRNIM
jgi:hypothetical protein